MLNLAMTLVLLAPAAQEAQDLDAVVSLLELVIEADEDTAVSCLEQIAQQVQSGELEQSQLKNLEQRLSPSLRPILAKRDARPIYTASLVLAALWRDTSAAAGLREIATSSQQPEQQRLKAIEALAFLQDSDWLSQAVQLLGTTKESSDFQAKLLASLGRYENPKVAEAVLGAYASLPAALQPKAVGLLTQRAFWSKKLLASIERRDIPSTVLNVNQMRGLLASSDRELAEHAKKLFGSVRTERDPQREQLIAEMKKFLMDAHADRTRGEVVFHRVCGQCHRIHGAGQEVGPDITSNGRASFDQLLSNVFDPSLVIGPGYQAVTVVTSDGRVLTGLVAEDNEQRIVLKLQGGKVEIVARADVDEVAPSKLSLMPEGLEKQITQQELADLFAFLVLDRGPADPAARPIPGTPPSLVNP